MKISQLLSEEPKVKTSKASKRYEISCQRYRSPNQNPTKTSGTLEELIKAFSYSLETGKAYEREKGNAKINLKPANIDSLVKNLNLAIDNAAANGDGGRHYSFTELDTTPTESK